MFGKKKKEGCCKNAIAVALVMASAFKKGYQIMVHMATRFFKYLALVFVEMLMCTTFVVIRKMF